ncbi:hypothetical protein [Agrobacterium vitis]|uniref:hypothetical protein n=2 Tax=Agrobacterium vitis TaxID=373 RepID=UPI0012EAA560|nr:hypothetical protein [Agrobacterium vitis]MUO70085.1 hypothetical protein [Agrobacterium vitis]
MDRAERIERLSTFAAEGRIIRGVWHRTAEDGRELACLLGALGSDISSSADCPADVMPRWLAGLTPSIDDNTSEEAWSGIIARYAAASKRWHALDGAAWRRVQVEVLISTLEIAMPHDTENVVKPVIDLLLREQAGDTPTQDEWAEAAAAARAAARAGDKIAVALLSAIEDECTKATAS